MIAPDTSSSKFSTVTAASQQINLPMTARIPYVFTSSVDCWVSQGAAPTASAADGSFLVQAFRLLEIDGTDGAKLAVLRVGAVDGVCTLARRRG